MNRFYSFSTEKNAMKLRECQLFLESVPTDSFFMQGMEMSLRIFMSSMMTNWRSSSLIPSDCKVTEGFRAPRSDASSDSSTTINRH